MNAHSASAPFGGGLVRRRARASSCAAPCACEPLEARRLLANAFEFYAGRVVVEAEQFDSKTAASGHSWQQVSGGVGGAMKALPDNGANINQNIASTSPRLNYSINFPSAGNYNIFIRGEAVAGNVGTSDSLHVGLDGLVQSRADNFTGFGPDFDWASRSMDEPSVKPYISVPSAGVHTVKLYMREDGLTIDRFFITLAGISPGAPGHTYPFGPGPRASERLNTNPGPPSPQFVGSLNNPSPMAGPAEMRFVQGNYVSARSVVPLPDGRFYLFETSDVEGTEVSAHTVTRHFHDGRIDPYFGDSVFDEGVVTLDGDSPLVTGRVFPQPGGGFLVWVAGSGSPNRIYRFDLELNQDTGYGGGDGFIENNGGIDIAADGGVVELRHLNPDTVRWTRYNRSGGVVLQVDRPAPHVGAIAPDGFAYESSLSIETLADGSVLVVLYGSQTEFRGLRKFNADFTPNTTWAGDGVADLTVYEPGAVFNMIETHLMDESSSPRATSMKLT